MKNKYKKAFMKTAYTFAECSHAVRLKVGCVIVKDGRIISIGYNGTPSGWDNECERRSFFDSNGKQLLKAVLVTRDEVLHAETNAIAKLARCHESGEGATLVTTHAPCLHCAKLIYQSGIDTVIFAEEYRSLEGVAFLSRCNVVVEQFKSGEL
jgi:dCMP deaminase